jgi:ATP-dependent Lhr-like helicase
MEASEALLEVVPPCNSDENALAALTVPVRAWFVQRFGRPTVAQRTAWPVLSAGRHLLLSAPTGTGKTLAAFAPLLGELLTLPPAASVRCLYLAPLKALGNDVRKNLRACLAGLQPFLAEPRPLPRVVLRTGDTPAAARQRLWVDPPEILLTTPETLALLLTHAGAGDLFGGLRWVIVDEVHALAASKRGADLMLSLERLEALRVGTPRSGERGYEQSTIQRIGLSATSTPLTEAGCFLVGAGRPCVLASVGDTSPLELTLRPLPPLPPPSPPSDGGEGGVRGKGFVRTLADEVLPELALQSSTLIFTNTRSLAERLAWALRRRMPAWNGQIVAHHSSLAPGRRRRIERQLKRGRLRAVVSSTSLELGIDIGSVDLVVLVHPPGDVVRLLQRVGRAGHGPGRARRGLVLTATTAELLEAAVTGASGRLRECEPLRVPAQPLDVLCQQLLGMAATHAWTTEEAFALVRRAWPFRNLSRADFDACLDYLTGRSTAAGDWLPSRLSWEKDRFSLLDERTARLLRRNLGTILAEEPCPVILETLPAGDPLAATPSTLPIGHVDEVFAERLQPGDRFLLDGRCLEYRRLERSAQRGGGPELMVVEVMGRPRTPVWGGEGWPLSAELARRLYVFRGRASEALRDGPDALAQLLRTEYVLDGSAVDDLVAYFLRQEALSEVPDASTCLIEAIRTSGGANYHVHTPLNRKANDALARVASARLMQGGKYTRPVLSVVADLGFALWVHTPIDLTPEDFRVLLSGEGFEEELRRGLADSLVLRERFRRVALVGLMLLRHPLGQRRRVGGPAWAERRLFDQVRASCPDFVLLRQAEGEVQDLCDVAAARAYLDQLPRLTVRCRWLSQSSPFVEAWTQTTTAVADPVESPAEVLQRLHASLMNTGGR